MAKCLLISLMVLVLGAGSFGCVAPAKPVEVENIATFDFFPPVNTDPALIMDYSDIQTSFNLYDTLTYPAPGGGIEPHLATNWKLSPDAKTWTFTLREGVKFHDGTELTAEDVVFSMERMLAIGMGFSGFFLPVERVTAPDKYTVIFELNMPFAEFPVVLVRLPILNKDLVMQHIEPGEFGELGDYGQKWLAMNSAGSGPYILVEHKPMETLLMERFEDYFLGWESFEPGLVPIDKVLFRMIWEPAPIITLMKAREHDMTDMWQSMEVYVTLAAIEGIELFSINIGNLYTIWLNTRCPPTDCIHFRRAISYVFDYQAILGLIPGSTQAGPIPSVVSGFDPELPLFYRDLEKAKEELEMSKYDPKEVTFKLTWTAGIPFQEKIAIQLMTNLKEIGIENVEITGVPFAMHAAMVGSLETTPNASMFMFSCYYPSADFYLYYMYHPALTGGMYAAHWMADEELGELIDQARATLNEEERLALYKRLQKEIMARVPAIYIGDIPEIRAKQDYIYGPKNIYPVKGPNENFRNFQLNSERKTKLLGG